MDIFEKLSGRIKNQWKNTVSRLKAYLKHLLFPWYLFPIKLLTYTAYYFVKFCFKLLFALIGLTFDCIKFPFRSLKNFLKSIVIFGVVFYLFASIFVIFDYLTTHYGYIGKFFCAYGTQEMLKNRVVRIVGGYSEGSGFFITPNKVITNFHVIADEPSPKIILSDGKFITPYEVIGDSNADLALLSVLQANPDLVLPLTDDIAFRPDEPVIATGYPMGTELSGKATAVKGTFIDFRRPKSQPVGYIQTNISLVEGMSGGPLTDQCGQVVGINTLGLAGLSLFINGSDAKRLIPQLSGQEIAKIKVDPSISPEEGVIAFYTYLKARRMRDGYNLLSQEYLQKTNYQEWTNRFTDILDVEVYLTEKFENSKDTVFVKFGTKNWVDGEVDIHYYEGTWQTIPEAGVYKMNKSLIKEVNQPSFEWFYE